MYVFPHLVTQKYFVYVYPLVTGFVFYLIVIVKSLGWTLSEEKGWSYWYKNVKIDVKIFNLWTNKRILSK